MKTADRQAGCKPCLSSLPSCSSPELQHCASVFRPLWVWVPICSVQSEHPQGEHQAFFLLWPVARAHLNLGFYCNSQPSSLRVSASDLLLTLYTCCFNYSHFSLPVLGSQPSFRPQPGAFNLHSVGNSLPSFHRLYITMEVLVAGKHVQHTQKGSQF